MSNSCPEKSENINPVCYEDLEKVANAVRSKVTLKDVPTIGIICGSGLGDLAELVKDKQILPYSEIPGFPNTKVVGHKGNVVFGYMSGKYVMCVQGRFHPYEHGMQLALCAMPVRIMHLLGVKTLIVSNAAGGVNEKFKLGDIMIIKDHIFLPAMCGFSPFIGAHDERFGPRFISMHSAYDLPLRVQMLYSEMITPQQADIARRKCYIHPRVFIVRWDILIFMKKALEIAKEQGIRMFEGIYCMTAGPQYETPAEVRMLKALGADALGMSTCHEVAVARQQGMRVFGISVITNIANQNSDAAVEVAHKEVLDTAREVSERTCKFVAEVVKLM